MKSDDSDKHATICTLHKKRTPPPTHTEIKTFLSPGCCYFSCLIRLLVFLPFLSLIRTGIYLIICMHLAMLYFIYIFSGKYIYSYCFFMFTFQLVLYYLRAIYQSNVI